MVDFKMVLNPYGGKNIFLKNSIPLTLVGQWGKYASRPATDWLDCVFTAISKETYEDYELTVAAESFECLLFEYLCAEHPDCTRYRATGFPCGVTASQRREAVERLKEKYNVKCEETQYDIPVFCENWQPLKGMKNAMFEEAFLYLSNCENESVLSNFLRLDGFRIFISIAEESSVLVKNGKILWRTAPDKLSYLLDAILTRFREIPILVENIESLRSFNLSAEDKETLLWLESIDEYFTVEDVPALELGSAHELCIKASTQEILDEIRLEVADPNVISINGKSVIACAVGETEIRCFRGRESCPSAVKRVKVYRTNYVRSINIICPDKLALGEKGRIAMEFFPADAEDANAVTVLSSNDSVLKIDNTGCFQAIGVGKVDVLIKSARLTEKRTIRVLADISAFLFKPQITQLYVGEKRRLTVEKIPIDVYDASYTLYSLNRDIIDITTIDGETYLDAKSVGNCTIVCRANRGGYETSFSVVVESSFERRGRITLHPLLGVSFFLQMLSWIFLFVARLPYIVSAGASVVCALISIKRKKKSICEVRPDELPLAREIFRKNCFWAITLILCSIIIFILTKYITF